jgi:hypothetical protein
MSRKASAKRAWQPFAELVHVDHRGDQDLMEQLTRSTHDPKHDAALSLHGRSKIECSSASLLRLDHEGVDLIVRCLRQKHCSDCRDEAHGGTFLKLLGTSDPNSWQLSIADSKQVGPLQCLCEIIGSQRDCHAQSLIATRLAAPRSATRRSTAAQPQLDQLRSERPRAPTRRLAPIPPQQEWRRYDDRARHYDRASRSSTRHSYAASRHPPGTCARSSLGTRLSLALG